MLALISQCIMGRVKYTFTKNIFHKFHHCIFRVCCFSTEWHVLVVTNPPME